ncbi:MULTISPECIES: Do family serine endopeptidase [unclassified Roseitalea]|uniref:Do family serine endopeptidase n=1 Tax=unclassified Roseitalea TaxID=2639107 RepID=UPI00274012DC|nr:MULTISPECIES: Do family serine endopeptidase [unclassified Roseitalea]
MHKSRFTSAVIAAAVVGAGFTGYSAAQFTSPALAEPVRLEAPAVAPGFANVVEAVSPAVVSVRVRAQVEPVSDRSFGREFGSPFEDLPESHPFRRFFDREFGDRFEDRRFGQRGPDRPRRARPISQGSGFFISGDGFLVTNNHVIDNGSEFTVIMNDGTEYDAELVGADPRTDLAVLKVDENREFTYVEFGDDFATRVGDWVVAVGNPFGLGGTVTAGIVSARGRDIGAGPYDDFLQIDAAVNRGNSGGPTFNLSGEVVGVNTAIFSPSGGNVGIAFAVPASVAKDVVSDLIDDGMVERGWLGVRIQPVTDEIAEALGLERTEGAIVADPEEGAPAATAGIRAGDVITAVNGETVEGPRELSRSIAAFDPGTDVTITVQRDGEARDIDVELGELPTEMALDTRGETTPDEQVEPSTLDELGMTVVPAEEGDGVLITDVEPDSPAFQAGIRPGDIIREVNNVAVASAGELEERIGEVADQGRGAALLRLEGENASRFVAVPLPQG